MSTVTGVDKVTKNMKALSKRYGENVAEAIVESAHLVRGTAIKSIQEETQGKVVTKSRGETSYKHTQAAKGEAPNTDTGALVRSIQVEVEKNAAYIGSGLNYAKHLEFGSHPFLVPALEVNRKNVLKLIKIAVKETK